MMNDVYGRQGVLDGRATIALRCAVLLVGCLACAAVAAEGDNKRSRAGGGENSDGGKGAGAGAIERVFPLDASQVAEVESDSEATGCARATLNAEQTMVTFYIEHNVENPTAAFVGFAPAGNFGANQFSFGSAASPIEGTWQIPEGLVDEFIGDPSPFLYVRIDSEARPEGDIRGQILDASCEFEGGGEGEGEGEEEAPPVGCFVGKSGVLDYVRSVIGDMVLVGVSLLVLMLGGGWFRTRDSGF